MDFLHWKEAEKRTGELDTALAEIDTEIAELDAEAKNDATTVDRRDAILKEIPLLLSKRQSTQTEQDTVVAARDKLKATEERQVGLLSNMMTNNSSARAAALSRDITETRQYELAWTRAVMIGDYSEVRNLLSSADNTLLVPKTLANRIEDVMKTGGRIINLCSQESIKGISEWPIANLYSDPEMYEEKSTGAKKEKEITLSSVTMEAQFIAEILNMTRKFETDSVEAFWAWIMAELPDALLRVIDRKILTGSQAATEGIHGILTNTKELFVSTLESAVIDFNVANRAIALLDEGVDDNVTIVMHRETFFNNVAGLKDTSDRPIYVAPTDNTARIRHSMCGYPVVFSPALPSYDAAPDGEAYMVAGNFNAYKVNFPDGRNASIVRDNLTWMDRNRVRYLSEIYVAGNITRLRSFAKVTKA